MSAEGAAWALGERSETILTWNGDEWSEAASGAPAGATLNALVALSDSDVWAVGGTAASPLVLHFDGSAWTSATLPAMPVPGVELTSVSGSAAADVWAVGPDASGRRGLVLHFDGLQWSSVTPPSVGASAGATVAPGAASWAGPSAVACAGASDVWVAGERMLHFDGAGWTETAPSPGRFSGTAAVVSSADIWLPGADRRSLAHFDGSGWTRFDAAAIGAPATAGAPVGGIAASSAGVVWVVGTTASGAGEAPLIVRGDAAGWRVVVDSVHIGDDR